MTFSLAFPLFYISTCDFQSGDSFPIRSCMTLTTSDRLAFMLDVASILALLQGGSARLCSILSAPQKRGTITILTVVWQSKYAG